MTKKLNQNFKLLFLLSFCMLFILKSFTNFSFNETNLRTVIIDTTEESESESNEKITEEKVEYEDFKHDSIFLRVVNFNKKNNFLFYNFHLSFSSIEGIELPPES